MAFVVEDGTGLSTATSYLSEAAADSYHADRENVLWAGTSAQKQSALIRATDYIEAIWSCNFRGKRSVAEQALSFPRLLIYDDLGNAIEGVPQELKDAVAILAMNALSSSLFNDTNSNTTGSIVKRTKKRIGPIEVEDEFDQNTSPSEIKSFPEPHRLIRQLIYTSGKVFRG